MVGLIERFRKPKLPVVLGSPPRGSAVRQQPDPRSQHLATPVLRNFSYPTNITNRDPIVSTAPSLSTWDQLGEICSFSSDPISRTRQDRTAGLEVPFFYTTDCTPHKQLFNGESNLDPNHEIIHSTDVVILSTAKLARKRQRRSTILGVSSTQVQATSRL
jgi:hypothetical protein